MTSLDAPPLAPARTTGLGPAATLLFALLVLAQVAIVVFQLWEPAFDGEIRFDDIAPLGGAYWPMNVLLGGPAFALGTVTASVFLAVLGAGRGNVLALTGAALHLLAGLVFALVITAEVLPFAWAADPAVMDPAQGRTLFDLYNDRFDAFLPYILGSMALVALGALLGLVGAAVSGGLPWWVFLAALGLVVALFAIALGNPLGLVADLGQRVLWIYVGWRGLQAVRA